MMLLTYFIIPSLFLLTRTERNNDKPRISDRENILMASVGLLGYLQVEICSSDTAGLNALETLLAKLSARTTRLLFEYNITENMRMRRNKGITRSMEE
jgi:hypothetical protein